MAPLRVISIIKTITARKIFERFPSLKKQELWGGEFWSAGKYIGTVGEATSEKTIRNYIRNQSTDKKKTETRMKQLKLFKALIRKVQVTIKTPVGEASSREIK